MEKLRMKDKTGLFLGLGILILCMLCAPAYATTDSDYNYDGFPLTTIESGTVNGDVYVSAGDNAGLQGTAYATNTFITNFTDVPTDNISWAELKVGVWGGSPSRVGWAETSLNGTTLSNETLDIIDPALNGVNVSCCGSGIYLIHYDCTDVVNNLNNGVIQARVVTQPNNGLGASRRLDGRVYGAVLIVVYEDGTSYTQYWINQGDLNLHKNATATIDNTSCSFEDLDSDTTWFNGTVNTSLTNSNLTVAYFAGDINQTDYLYFNVPDGDDSPYDLTNFNWDRDAWSGYLLGTDVANNMSNTAYNFDLKTFSVNMNTTGNNYAIFWRGHGSDDPYETEIYDPSWPGVNSETEGYYTPFLAVLTRH